MNKARAMGLILEFAGDEMKKVLDEQGEETLLKSIQIINTMSKAVKDEYGQCPEIMFAIDIMHSALLKIRNRIKNDTDA